jgi:outer membrane scaffolding protein for murein synthesis (MipA/OmpV family)
VLVLFAVAPALATDLERADAPAEVGAAEPAEQREIVADLGLGVRVTPEFPAAEQYIYQPWPIAELQFLRIPVLGEVVTGDPSIVSVYPSFDIVGERESGDAAYLAGTDDVDHSVEIGPGLALERGGLRGFAQVRYGVSGHNGFVAEAGVDYVSDQHERFRVTAGPRISLASGEYMDAYFSVPAGAALPAYDADGGLKDIGVDVEATYAVTRQVRVHATAGYRRYVGQAGDSPIVDAGDQNRFTLGIGLSYRFGLDLY